MQIKFLGATQTVTGSKYLLTTKEKFLLVDCGLFQGHKPLRLRNWHPLPIHPAKIDAVILTHAHIDHSGYIPLLVKEGFRGKIYCSNATRDLCEILLPDSGFLQEEEARYALLKGYSKHNPPKPLYTREEAEQSLSYFHPIPFNQSFQLSNHLYAQLYPAGHILGAACVRIWQPETSIFFSGDLGRQQDPIMYPPHPPEDSDFLVVESTYGDRKHLDVDPKQQLGAIINETIHKGGKVLLPAFAVGRAQSLLYYIHQLKANGSIPNIPVYLDSPMATDVTELFYQHSKLHRLTHAQSAEVCKTAKYIRTTDESIALNNIQSPMIIISASGMATGGRVLHHLKKLAPYSKNAVVFCGFQAGGTRGDHLVTGKKHIKLLGQMVEINARVFQLDNMSAHADYAETLDWLSHLTKAPKKVFITHGEPSSSMALKQKIEQRFQWHCEVPLSFDEYSLI